MFFNYTVTHSVDFPAPAWLWKRTVEVSEVSVLLPDHKGKNKAFFTEGMSNSDLIDMRDAQDFLKGTKPPEGPSK